MRDRIKGKKGKLLCIVVSAILLLLLMSAMVVVVVLKRADNTKYIIYKTHIQPSGWNIDYEPPGTVGKSLRICCFPQV